MTINVIYDDRHWEDYNRLLEEFKNQNITNYTFWDATIDSKDVVSSINASHKKIIKWAKENKLKEVCIAEQDLMFTSDNSWDFFLKNKPEIFDIYLCGTYILPMTNKKICGFHLYVVHEKYYDTFLSVDDSKHIDTEVGEVGGDFHFCYPFPAIQKPSKSFNHQNGEIVNYNLLLKEEDIYNGSLYNI